MNKHCFCIAGILLAAVCLTASVSAGGEAVKWDYLAHPVKATENLPAPDSSVGLCVASAFDGFGTSGPKPACARAWHQGVLPTEQKPLVCEIDYGKPTLVTAFVNYCYAPGCSDMRFTAPGASAFKKLRISARDDGGSWQEIKTLADLSGECPQVMPTAAEKPWRFWRLEILELAAGAEFLCTYELETYTGGVPQITRENPAEPDPLKEFAERIARQKPSEEFLPAKLTLAAQDAQTLGLKTEGNANPLKSDLHLLIDGKPVPLKSLGDKGWQAELESGRISLETQPSPLGLLMKLRYLAKEGSPVKYARASLQLTAAGTELYYMPAYAWSRSKIDTMVSSCHVQTRMAVLGIPNAMLCLFPGTDRGSLGFIGGAIRNDLLLGPEATPVLLSVLPGDWWNAYRFAVDDIYGFCEPRQTVPVSEMQYGISRYMLRDDIWEPTLGTVKSWSKDDFTTKVYGGFDAFNLYGVPHSIPSYWARYVMSGDPLARERCRSIALWLCRSGVRMAEGPAQGAFFSSQRFLNSEPVKLDRRGLTQASTEILTSQATGVALWTLLYYRHVTGENDPEINRVIDEAAAWLLKTQTPDGGWPYGHTVDGKPAPGASSGGSIWNIRALWRLGKETGEAKFSEAAARGVKWHLKTFLEPHHYHGYWEDMGPNTREGYDAALAAVVYAEMGEKQAVIDCARDAVQWVFTRRIECREAACSAGLVSEQTGWPPAEYCNPMMALAAYSAWQSSEDPSWRKFAMIPKAAGWWYQPDTGAMLWIVDAIQLAPLSGPAFDSWWNDWCVAQSDTYMLRWLIREMNRRLEGNGVIDEETLMGKVLGDDVHAWAPVGGLHPILPEHGQVNWLGLRSGDTIKIVFMNFAENGPVRCELNSRTAGGALPTPKAMYIIRDGNLSSQAWDGKSAVIAPRDDAVILEWKVSR